MKLWILSTLSTVSLLILSGCGGTPIPAEQAKIDKTLPKVTLTQHGIIVGMKSVAFEWRDMLDPRVGGIYVYKKEPSTKEKQSDLIYYTTLNTRFTTHFVDNDVEPDTRYTYKFRTFSDSAEGLDSKLIVINTLPVLESVSWIHSITGLPRVAKIIWRPHTNEKVEKYIIERKASEDEKWEEIARVKGRLSAEYIDEGLADSHVYQYRVRVVTYDNITSTPSQIVKIVTKALPISVSNIKTTKKLPKKIHISWSESTQKDFAYYILYRSDAIDGNYEAIAQLTTNFFSDKIDEDGKSYFYRVSVVDKDGLESISDKNSVHGMTLSKPNTPASVSAKLIGKSIEVTWSKTDERTASYTILRKHKKGWFDETSKEFTGITTTHFQDKNIEADSTYTYTVYSVDANGIKSEASTEVQVVTPESTELISAPAQAVREEVQTVEKVSQVHQEDVIAPSENLDLSGL